MVARILYFLYFSSFFLNTEASDDDPHCASVKCSDDGPEIRFPFRLKGRQPQRCGHPGFDLSCKENTTMIHFPTYWNLVVKSISYKNRKVSLLDHQSCVHGVFLNVNLSLTPFKYYYVVRNYTYLNCSTRLSPDFEPVSCLSGSRHHVYTVEPSLAMPDSCRVVKTVAIPFAYSPYLADNSFGLGLTWSLPECEDCEAKGGNCGFLSKSGLQTGCLNLTQEEGLSMKGMILGEISRLYMKVLFCVLAVTALISIEVYHSKKLEKQIENESLL